MNKYNFSNGFQKNAPESANANSLVNPELLVLDEATGGVDPLLRESIWKYLARLSAERGTTIVTTTNYIDEAKKSSMVGVIRHGRLIVEEETSVLLQTFNTSSLEDVVLRLCRQDNEEGAASNNILRQYSQDEVQDNQIVRPPAEKISTREKLSDCGKRIKAMVYKNLIVLFRSPLLFMFSAIVPSLIIYLMCMAYKSDPKNLNFGVVNYEVPNFTMCLEIPANTTGECNVENLSCRYIQHLLPCETLSLQSFPSEEEALKLVHEGDSWGYMIFPENFSSMFYDRAISGSKVDEDVLNGSQIIVKMDQSNRNIHYNIKKSLYEGFEEFSKSIMRDCGFDERQVVSVLHYNTPIFGGGDMKFVDFVAPSSTVAWLFFFPIISASIRYINEKNQGTYQRSLVAGTKTWEILFAYGCTELIVLIMQSALTFCTLTLLLGIQIHGSIPSVLALMLLAGLLGVSLGLMIGSLLSEEIEAALLAMALFFPNFLLSGIVWPVEGMPVVLQYVAYVLPCTTGAEAARSVFARGWGITHVDVYPGYIIAIGYVILFSVLTAIIEKWRTK